MLTKGTIIQRVIGTNKYLVDIPFLQNAGIQSDPYEAILSSSPSLNEAYYEGDVVILGFEDHRAEKPIILGKLYSDTSSQRGHENLESLTVGNSANLPENTIIGDITYNQLKDIFRKVDTIAESSIDGIKVGDNYYFPDDVGIVTIPDLEGASKEWVEEHFEPLTTHVYNPIETLTNINIEDNHEYYYGQTITSTFTFTIPLTNMGFAALVTLHNVNMNVDLTMINNSSKSIRIVNNNIYYQGNTFQTSMAGRKLLFFRDAGDYIEITIVEEIENS